MTKFKITIYSKHKKSISNFLKLFEHPCVKIHNFQLILNSVRKKKKKRSTITVLKSPHVNKKAQEHFQSFTYITILECFSWDIKKSVIILKKIKNKLFPDLNIKIERNISEKKPQRKSVLLSPNRTLYIDTNFLFKQQQKFKSFNTNVITQNLLKNTLIYLKISGNYGRLQKNSDLSGKFQNSNLV